MEQKVVWEKNRKTVVLLAVLFCALYFVTEYGLTML